MAESICIVLFQARKLIDYSADGAGVNLYGTF